RTARIARLRRMPVAPLVREQRRRRLHRHQDTEQLGRQRHRRLVYPPSTIACTLSRVEVHNVHPPPAIATNGPNLHLPRHALQDGPVLTIDDIAAWDALTASRGRAYARSGRVAVLRTRRGTTD